MFVFHVINYLEQPQASAKPRYASTESIRLFKNKPELYWSGVLHETLEDSIKAYNVHGAIKGNRADVLLHHYGYLRKKKRVKGKLDYYEALNNRQIEITEGKDARPYFNLALHYLQEEKSKDALANLQKAVSINPEFWHAHQQLAALNMKSAKHFLGEVLKYCPPHHAFRKEAGDMLKYLNQKSFGHQKVV